MLNGSPGAAIRCDWRRAALSTREERILAYVERLTLEPTSCRPADIEALREAELDDVGILQGNLIASFFNYINRVADSLRVGRGPAVSTSGGLANVEEDVEPCGKMP
jgi:uncharacterized protein YciW